MATDQYVVAELLMEDRERARRQKACFSACNICTKCEHFTSEYPECRACYPSDPEYQAVTHSWEHCHCRQLPWVDSIGGRQHSNLVLPSMQNPKVRDQFKQTIAEADKSNLVEEMAQALEESGVSLPEDAAKTTIRQAR